MANNPGKRSLRSKILIARGLLLLIPTSLLLLTILYLAAQTTDYTKTSQDSVLRDPIISRPIKPFDCYNTPQARPVIANTVEGIKFPFLYSLSDFGNLPDEPHKNIVRTLKGKPFKRPDISARVQELLEKLKMENRSGLFVDVGANVGLASFAAAVMGYKVLAFEPVFENLQRICEGIYFNRVGELVNVFQAAASDRPGNITFHKMVSRLDNSSVSATGEKLAVTSSVETAFPLKSIPIDEVIHQSEPVLLLKIDVNGQEYNVLKGASKLLSRNKSEAPYLIYEEEDQLLEASNSSAKEIRAFLSNMGYHHCVQHGTDAHCTKTE